MSFQLTIQLPAGQCWKVIQQTNTSQCVHCSNNCTPATDLFNCKHSQTLWTVWIVGFYSCAIILNTLTVLKQFIEKYLVFFLMKDIYNSFFSCYVQPLPSSWEEEEGEEVLGCSSTGFWAHHSHAVQSHARWRSEVSPIVPNCVEKEAQQQTTSPRPWGVTHCLSWEFLTPPSSCGTDSSHSPPAHHDSRWPGCHTHPSTSRGQSDDPAGTSAVCRQHPVRYHRGACEKSSHYSHCKVTSYVTIASHPFDGRLCPFTQSLLCRSLWWTSSMPRCAWVASLRPPGTQFLLCRSTKTRTLPSSRLDSVLWYCWFCSDHGQRLRFGVSPQHVWLFFPL